jgi:tetraacyldisaccharide 4'-kinase
MRIILLPLSLLFRIVIWIRNKLYKYEVIKTKRLNCKVISIGNVSSGGTGKTPMVEYVTRYFINKGKSVAVILKGYKRVYDDMQVIEFGYKNSESKLNTENFGDEALMLLENLPATESGRGLIVASDNKISGAKFADNKFKPDVVIIDDGFQLRKLIRDLDIVMVNPIEKKILLPVGNLREPFKNIKRADIIVFNHKFNKNINLLHKGNLAKVTDSGYKIENFVNIKNEILGEIQHNAIAFCGIGDPDSFKTLFEKLNIEVSEFIRFPDHHSFKKEDIEKIINAYKNKNADCILTTQKDFVRLKYPQAAGTELYKMMLEVLTNYPLYYANIKLQILHNEEFLNEKLENLLREIQ